MFCFQTGTEGDIDSDSSSIYEPIDDEVEDEQLLSDNDSVDTPPAAPELPPLRNQSANKKKKKKEGKGEKGDKEKKGLKGKIKQLYKGKSKETDGGLKVPGHPGLTTASSTGVLSKLKKLNRSKASNSDSNLEALYKNEDNPVCDSTGTDSEFEVGDMSQQEIQTDEEREGGESKLAPPPLPPRRASSSDVNEYEVPKRGSRKVDNLNNTRSSSELDPPLPPRNRISNNLDLNMVIPVCPGGGDR